MNENRIGLIALLFSGAALVGLALDEGYTTKAIPDPVKGRAVPTVGFGSTGKDITMASTTTPPKALKRMLADVQKFEGALKTCVTVPLHQHEYDAYIQLAYNIGPSAFCKSTLVKRLNAQDYTGACDAILMWRRVGGTDCSALGNDTCSGLWTRRLRLQAQCLGDPAL